MFEFETVIAYIRAGRDEDKMVEKQVEEIQEYCDEKDIIAMGFYEEISEEISEEMILDLIAACKAQNAKIIVAALSSFGKDLKKVTAVVSRLKEEGIMVQSLNSWDEQILQWGAQ